MSSDEYQVQNIYRYSRKSYNKVQSVSVMQDDVINNQREDTNADLLQNSPRSDDFTAPSSPGCSCDFDPETEITNILHKKCPVISLAQQQLQKILEGTNQLVAENSGRWSLLQHLLCLCKPLVTCRNACPGVLMVMMVFFAFFFGLLTGAATCGTYARIFNSPILNCIENIFVSDHYISIEDSYRSIT